MSHATKGRRAKGTSKVDGSNPGRDGECRLGFSCQPGHVPRLVQPAPAPAPPQPLPPGIFLLASLHPSISSSWHLSLPESLPPSISSHSSFKRHSPHRHGVEELEPGVVLGRAARKSSLSSWGIDCFLHYYSSIDLVEELLCLFL